MRLTTALLFLAVLVCGSADAGAERAAAEERLKELDAKIAAEPGDAKLHFEKVRHLMELERYDEGYQSAVRGRQLLGEREPFLRSTPLESIELEAMRIEVRLNLGRSERTLPNIGIVRPLTFRVWARGDVDELIETIDFEIGYVDGEPNTAALGQQQGQIHANFGALDPDSTYTAVRSKAIELIRRRVALKPVRPRSGKQYLNITLPGRSRFTPIILCATPDKTIFARVTQVDGKRDIQVLQGSGDRWEFVGEQGRALTGEDGNFLTDARQGPDGRLWVLVSYTPPSNPKMGWRTFLYSFREGRWSMAEPSEGHRASALDDLGLAFLGVNEPSHYQLMFGKKSNTSSNGVASLLQWNKGNWQPHPAEKILQKTGGRLVWSSGEAWVIVKRQAEGKTTVHGYRISGSRQEDITGPYQLLTLHGSYDLSRVHLSDHHRIALMLKEPAEPNQYAFEASYLGRIVDVTRPDQPVTESIATPPVDWLDHFVWSPKHELVMTDCDALKVRVFALRNGDWVRIAEASQDVSSGMISDPRLVFRADGVPLVTWQDFFPR